MYWKILLYLCDLLYLQWIYTQRHVRPKTKRKLQKMWKFSSPRSYSLLTVVGEYFVFCYMYLSRYICSYVRNLTLFYNQQVKENVSLVIAYLLISAFIWTLVVNYTYMRTQHTCIVYRERVVLCNSRMWCRLEEFQNEAQTIALDCTRELHTHSAKLVLIIYCKLYLSDACLWELLGYLITGKRRKENMFCIHLLYLLWNSNCLNDNYIHLYL